MKGVLILTEGRSGSNWLGSLTSKTALMGKSEEWLSSSNVRKGTKTRSAVEYLDDVVNLAATENDFFSIKVFPKHLHRFQRTANIDAVKYLYDRHDVRLIRLIRKDTFRQALSYGRGLQTRQWTSSKTAKREAHYDFKLFCSCFFLIRQSYAFWDAYIQFRGWPCEVMYYEDMVKDPTPYVKCVAEHANVEMPDIPHSSLEIQRDDLTEEWLKRFKEQIASDHTALSLPNGPFPRTGLNFARFMAERPLKYDKL